MAEHQSVGVNNFRGMGRVRVLLEAIEDFCRRGEAKDLLPHPRGVR